MALVCPIITGLDKDPKFQEVKSHYGDRFMNEHGDEDLAIKLSCYREKFDLSPDWMPETEQDYAEFTNFIDRRFYDETRNKSITYEYLTGLYRTMVDLYSPKILKSRLNLINSLFRRRVDFEAEKHPALSRQAVIESLGTDTQSGVQVIMDKVFKEIIEPKTTTEGVARNWKARFPQVSEEELEKQHDYFEYAAGEFKKMLENKEFLAGLAMPLISADEGIAVTFDGLEFDFGVSDESLVQEEYEEKEDDNTDKTESEKGERYVDFRTLSLMSTLSTEAKRLIRARLLKNSDGKNVVDDLRYVQHLDVRQTAIILHKVLERSEPSTMMDDLRAAVAKYPSLLDLVNYLEKNPDDQGIIWCNFKKAKSNYYYGYKDNNGVLNVTNARNPADNYSLSAQAGANITAGVTADEEYSVVNKDGSLKDRNFYYALDEIAGKNLAISGSLLRGLGFQVTDKEVIKLGGDALRTIGIQISGIADQAIGIIQLNNDLTGAHLYRYAQERFAEIADLLSPLQRAVNEERIISQNKSLQVYNSPNAIHRLVDILSGMRRVPLGNSEAEALQEYRTMLMREFGQYEGMSVSTGENTRLTGWLETATVDWVGLSSKKGMYKNPEEYSRRAAEYERVKRDEPLFESKDFRLLDMADSFKREYSELTDVQYAITSYRMFMKGGRGRIDSENVRYSRFYEVPIQSDYDTAYNFIAAPHYTYLQLVNKLADEVLCEIQRIEAIRQRLENDPKDPEAELNRAKNLTYESRGQKFQIFPELNTNGFYERYLGAPNPVKAVEIVRQEVDGQLKKLLESELAKLRAIGMFSRENTKALGYNNFRLDADDREFFESDKAPEEYTEEEKRQTMNPAFKGRITKKVELPGVKTDFGYSIADWVLNSFFARQQWTKLMYGGLENFKGIADFEKRNMYSHATQIPLYTEATYNGEKVGKENQRVLYIVDDDAKSAYYDHIAAVADKLVAQKKLTPDQAQRMKEAYKSITTTDGQGIRTLDSLRAVKIMARLWTEQDERAYKHIKSGRYTPDDAEHFMVGLKPVYTGYEIIPAQNGNLQKPVRMPVLHKYSEMVLLPEMLEGTNAQSDSVPFKAFNRINEKLGKGNEIDLFIFSSGVKVGGHSAIDAFAKDKDGNRILKDADSISDFVVGKIGEGDFWVHTLPFKYYGISAATHADVTDKQIAWASQAEKEAWGNILPGEKLTVGGREMGSEQARELYHQIKAARTIDSFKGIKDMFFGRAKLAHLMKRELAGKPYQSREMMFFAQCFEGCTELQSICLPNVQHDAAALITSVYRKRLTKIPTKGANVLQTSGFGMDVDSSNFSENGALKDFDKLEVKFDKNGRLQYVEAYIPMYDSRLEQFADSNGNITPSRLEELVAQGRIPGSVLNFIAYRTPSDAEHSIIPCRVKGFISNAAGPTIRLPKEIMKMTGHDYDGDKMRCHFKDFSLGWDEDRLHQDYENFSTTEVVQSILADSGDTTPTPYEVFRRNAVSETNPESGRYRAVKAIEYDYDKSPLDNIGKNSDYRALNNALVDLMFAQLTSENGSLKLFIPGGNAETTVYAGTMQVMRAYGSEDGKKFVRDALRENDVPFERASEIAGNAVNLYSYLTGLSEKKLSGIVDSISGSVSPFAVSHAVEAHRYMMDGAGMIGTYAIYNSASAMFQRLNLRYLQVADSNGDVVEVSLFGKRFDRLYPVISNNSFATLPLARLLNASVDNGKNPLLGHLNQSQKLAPLTNLLLAAGLSEEELHLVMNQPVVVELVKRMNHPSNPSLATCANGIVEELKQGRFQDVKFSQARSVREVANLGKEYFIEGLPLTYDALKQGSESVIKRQINILQTLQHLNVAAGDLDSCVKLTRPESNAGGIDSTIGGTIAKVIQLDKFRERLDPASPNPIRISGINGVLEYRKVLENVMSSKQIADVIGDELPEVVALNTLLKDSALGLLSELFPQAQEQWLRVIRRVAGQYSYDKIPGSVVERIGSDMFLWKILSNKEFVAGNPQEEQRRIVEETPKRLAELKERILKAERETGSDELATALSSNVFLNNLEIGRTVNVNGEVSGRIRFRQNGPSVEETADDIRVAWGQLLRYEETEQLAKDLFMYNLYTNGLSYGRYEFAHYAPFEIYVNIPEFRNAAFSAQYFSDWTEEDEENFYHQYCMNRWGDKNFLPKVDSAKLPSSVRQWIGYTGKGAKPMSDNDFSSLVGSSDYLLIPGTETREVVVPEHTEYRYDGYGVWTPRTVAEERERKTISVDRLWRVIRTDGIITGLEPAQKLGIRSYNNQVMLQYNPRVRDYRSVRPYFVSNDVAWENTRMSSLQENVENNVIRRIETQTAAQEAERPAPTATTVRQMEQAAQQVSAANNGKLTEEQARILGLIDEEDETFSEDNRIIKASDNLPMSEMLTKSIDSGNWSKETVEEFENLIKKVQNGEIYFKRAVGERRPYAEGISEAHAGATLLIRRHEGPDASERTNPGTEYEVYKQEGREHERIIEAWAKASGIWLNDYEDPTGKKARTLEDLLHSQWEFITANSEAEVYGYDRDTVLKSIDLSHVYDNPGMLLDRLSLFNKLFPETAVDVVGFGRDSSGRFRVIFTQRFIHGEELLEEDLDEFHSRYNLQRTLNNNTSWFKSADGTALIYDLSPSNIIKDKNGNYFVIDADVVYNTPARGGNVTFENSFTEPGKQSNNKMFYLIERDEQGNPIRKGYPSTPGAAGRAREQEAFRELNKKLREILRRHGVDVGVLEEAEARVMAGGVSDFRAAHVVSEGLKELIRISNGIEGEWALPEEFAHVALEMLGKRSVEKDADGNVISFNHDNILVSRLLNALNNDDEALEEAYDGMLGEYENQYGKDNREKLVVEAAGKLVAKHLFLHQMAKTPSIRNLVSRVVEAIKSFFRRFSTREIDEAMFDADKIASQLARDLLSGRLDDQLKLENITSTDVFLSINNDLSGKEDILSRMKKTTVKQIDILNRRMRYTLKSGATSRSLDAAREQLVKLEKTLQGQKLETTVVDYLKGIMSFMSEMEGSLDATVNNRPANAVCKKLRIVKDTLYGYASVLEDVQEAIHSGELANDVDLEQAVDAVSKQMTKFWGKYHDISLLYFEQFLSGVYGKDGVTVSIGKQKGRKITIHEMATKADHDVSFLSRMLNAVSDIDDYVLQAIDSVTRDAKMNARERLRSLRPRLEAAFAALVKEQGNRDQSWMFERKEVDGKLVRSGKYINKYDASRLSKAKQDFYNVFMELKAIGDSCLPEAMVGELKMIMFRKEHYEKMKEAQGARGKAAEEWEAAKRSVLEMGDVDFENEKVLVDFEDNKVDMLPAKFLFKGKNESFDDMTEDAATSLMAYLGMALEYKEMNNVLGILENARYMASRRDVQQRKGSRQRVEEIEVGENGTSFKYREPYTVKQARTNLQKAIDDFFQMHVYGHLRKDEGTFGKTRISKRKVVDTTNRFTSLSQMAINLHQRIANVNTGFTQVVVEAAGGKIKVKDVAWATSIWMKESADRLAETGKTDYANKLSLWLDKFDIHQDNGRDAQSTKYGKTNTSRVFNEGLLYAGLSVGEDFLAGTTALAFARNYKLREPGPDGKTCNLWDAYTVKYVDEENQTGAYLALKEGYTKEDGTPFTFEDEKNFTKLVIGTNFELQGIYNIDDRSAIQQHSLGALAIMYRKWIAPALKRRYAGVQYSNLKGDYTEGYYRTAVNLAGNAVKDWFSPASEEDSEKTVLGLLTDIRALKNAVELNWDKLTDYEKGNVRKALTELAVVFGLIVCSALLIKLPPDDHEGNKFLCWADDLAVTQILRLRSEIGSQAPTPDMLNESLRIMSSPFAALRPLRDSLNIFQLMWPSNYFEVVQSGRYKGRTKAHKYFMSLPVISMFRKFDNFIDPSPLINYYKNQNY